MILSPSSEKQKHSTREVVKKNIKTIAEQSSIHGLPNVVSTEYMWMRTLWLVVLLLAITYCSYLLVDLILSYFNYDVLVSISYVSDYNVDFPAIALCDFVPINRTINDMLISCQFNSNPCNMSYFGTVFSSKFGLCNTFNAYKEGRPVLKSYKAGIDFGVSFELFAGVPNMMSSMLATSGLAVAIYNASSRPSFTEESIRVSPGRESSLMVSRQEMHKLAQPFSKCIENVNDPKAFNSDEFRYTLTLSRSYRQKICISTCSTKNLIDTAELEAATLTQIVRNVTDCLKTCPEECNLIEFKVFQYFTHYPNDAYALKLKERSPLLANLSVEDVKKSVILLNVNYETMMSTVTEETPAMPFPTLLGNLGGQLGLFLGMSFLSFFEVLEIVFIIVWEFYGSRIRLKKRQKNISINQVDSFNSNRF